jgi:urate oxidase
MTARPSAEQHGVKGVRVLRSSQHGDRYEIRDLTVDIAIEGGLAGVEDGTTDGILSAQTLSNAVNALAGRHGGGEPEEFALALSHHFSLEHDWIERVRVDVRALDWGRLDIEGRPVGAAFRRSGDERTAHVTRVGTKSVVVEAGIARVPLLKTAHVAFQGHARDIYSTDDPDSVRPLEITLTAKWRYGWSEVPYRAQWHQVRRVLFDAFAEHASLSAQHTTHVLGRAVLDQCPAVSEVELELVHLRPKPIDLSRFGITESGELFTTPDGPAGTVRLALRRGELEP